MMNKKTYQNPAMELIRVDFKDLLRTSVGIADSGAAPEDNFGDIIR